MSPLYTALTVGSLIRELAASVGDLVFSGTPTAQGTTTTLIDAALGRYWTANDDEALKGAWLYLIAGTGTPTDAAAGMERPISAYTAATGTLTWTGAADDTTEITNLYGIVRQRRPTEYLRALQAAQRYQAQRGLGLLPVVGREGIVGNLVPNGNFDLFTTANVPDGVTIDPNSTFTMETTVTFGQRHSLKMTTDGTNAGYVRFDIPQWGKFKGKTVRCYARVYTSVAARTTLDFYNFSTSTPAETDTVTTASTWELLEVSNAYPDVASRARVAVNVSAGSAVSVYTQLLYVADPEPSFEQAAIDADRALAWIGDLKYSTQSVLGVNGLGYHFADGLRTKNFSIVEDTEDTPRLLRLDVAGALRGHVLEYKGYKIHPEFTGPTVSFAGTPELILPRARAILLRNSGADTAMVRDAEAEAREAEATLSERPNLSLFKRVMAQ